jgi:hypothetical protein
MDKEFIFGVAQVKFATGATAPTEIGYIAGESFDLGGTAGETVDINAAQVKGAPVFTIPSKNATIKPKFELIQLNYNKMALLMGGSIAGTTAAPTGWKAPTEIVKVSGHFQVITDSGHLLDIPNGTVAAYLGDKLNLAGVAKVYCEVTPNIPADGSSPYTITDYPPVPPEE